MAIIIQRYAEKLKYTFPIAFEAENFTDEKEIIKDMKNAVRTMQQTGIMNTKDGYSFEPKKWLLEPKPPLYYIGL